MKSFVATFQSRLSCRKDIDVGTELKFQKYTTTPLYPCMISMKAVSELHVMEHQLMRDLFPLNKNGQKHEIIRAGRMELN